MENILLIKIIGVSVILISAIFVYIDTKRNNLDHLSGQKGFFNLSTPVWTLAVLWIWFIAFPLYLLQRRKLITKAMNLPVELNQADSAKRSYPQLFIFGLMWFLFVLSNIFNIGNLTIGSG